MREVKITKKVYTYDELDFIGQSRALNDEIGFYVDVDWSSKEYVPDFIREALAECERLKTPWFFDSFIYDYGQDHLLKNLRDREYNADGSIFTS